MNVYRDPFFCVPRSVHATSQGEVALPIFYFDRRKGISRP